MEGTAVRNDSTPFGVLSLSCDSRHDFAKAKSAGGFGADAETGSPREILMLGYKTGFLADCNVWLTMLKMRNQSVHIYDQERIDELILLIKDSFIPVFEQLEAILKSKLCECC